MKTWEKISVVLTLLFLVLFALGCYIYREDIYRFTRDHILKERDNLVISKNEYYKDEDFLYVQNTSDFIVKDKQHIKNAIYTILNSGTPSFTFYCDDAYKSCLTDVDTIAKDQIELSNINNFVHPYNSFAKIDISYTTNGKMTLKITKNYTDEDIKELNAKVDEVIASEITDEMTPREKISTIHNYIINNGKYVSDDLAFTDVLYNKANGILLEGTGLCSSYADAMALFLEKFDVKNLKIASDTHVWNLVLLDDNWYHLDLTWDDPVVSDGKDYLEVLFLLITDDRLKELEVEQHEYDEGVYLELKS